MYQFLGGHLFSFLLRGIPKKGIAGHIVTLHLTIEKWFEELPEYFPKFSSTLLV